MTIVNLVPWFHKYWLCDSFRLEDIFHAIVFGILP